ncbi:hypothetical protein BFRIPC_00078 (plasmid) [Peribacillus frigoritolerans]
MSSLVVVLGLLLSGCGGNEEATSKPKTCEEVDPCKTALKYVTFENQGANDKLYTLELDGEKGRSFGSLQEAKDSIPEDYESVKDKKIEKYAILEYEVITGKEFTYKIEFKDLRTNENEATNVKVVKQDGQYLVENYYRFVGKSDVEKSNGEVSPPTKYYSKGLSQAEKDELEPEPVEIN